MPNGYIADRFAHDIVTFMRNWAPYGGPPADEVLPEFGLTREQLVARYQEILAAAAAARQARIPLGVPMRRTGQPIAPRPPTPATPAGVAGGTPHSPRGPLPR